MTCNVGKGDRIFRVLAGIAIGVIGYIYQSWLGLIGLVPILTAIIGFCPLYWPFRINTAKPKETTT